ncbi:MAG: DUF4097 family beta strand repeat-containing protein [Peptostreptococcaceae bacterium]
MNRSRGVFIIILCLILIVFLGGILVKGTVGSIGIPVIMLNDYGKSTKLTEENQYTAELNDIKYIKLDTTVDDIIIEESSDKDIKIIEKSNYKLDDREKLKITKNGNGLEIVRNDKNSIIGRNNINRKLEIYLPKDYNNSITLENNVGDIKVHRDLKLDKLSINQNVGDLKLDSIIECNNFDFKNSTGDIEIKNIKGNGNIESKVGNIECYIEKITGDVSINATTGDIDLFINKDNSFILDSKNNIGDLDTNINLDDCKTSEKSLSGNYGKDAKYLLKVGTNVGDLNINLK